MLDEKLVWLVDIEFYIRLLLENSEFEYIAKTIIGIGHDGKQMTDLCQDHPGLILKEKFYVFKKLRVLHNKEGFMQLVRSMRDYLKNAFHADKRGINK